MRLQVIVVLVSSSRLSFFQLAGAHFLLLELYLCTLTKVKGFLLLLLLLAIVIVDHYELLLFFAK